MEKGKTESYIPELDNFVKSKPNGLYHNGVSLYTNDGYGFVEKHHEKSNPVARAQREKDFADILNATGPYTGIFASPTIMPEEGLIKSYSPEPSLEDAIMLENTISKELKEEYQKEMYNIFYSLGEGMRALHEILRQYPLKPQKNPTKERIHRNLEAAGLEKYLKKLDVLPDEVDSLVMHDPSLRNILFQENKNDKYVFTFIDTETNLGDPLSDVGKLYGYLDRISSEMKIDVGYLKDAVADGYNLNENERKAAEIYSTYKFLQDIRDGNEAGYWKEKTKEILTQIPSD